MWRTSNFPARSDEDHWKDLAEEIGKADPPPSIPIEEAPLAGGDLAPDEPSQEEGRRKAPQEPEGATQEHVTSLPTAVFKSKRTGC